MSKAFTKEIKAESSLTIQLKDKWAKFSYSETRELPILNEHDVEKERALLWETVNNEVDKQVVEFLNLYKK